MMDLIDLADLSKPPGMPALDIMMGAVHAITAGICLEQNTHNSGVGLKVTGDSDGTFFVMWPTITEQHRRTHYDLQYATERGACGIALGKPLDQEEMFDSSADIMAEYLTLMEHYTEGRNSEIENVLDDKAYYRNFVSQARKLVPDGKRISTVGFTSMRAGQVRKLALKKQPPIDWKSQDESTSTKRVVVKGMLSAASSIDKNFIVIVDENNPQQYVIQVPKGMMSDIVKPLWESRVSVEADQNGNNYELVSIEPADTE